MSKTTHEDSLDIIAINSELAPICGTLHVAANGIAVVHDMTRDRMIATHKSKLVIRQFNGPVARNWVGRQVNAFAEHVATATAGRRGRSKKAA